jgi:hypothetical protein
MSKLPLKSIKQNYITHYTTDTTQVPLSSLIKNLDAAGVSNIIWQSATAIIKGW